MALTESTLGLALGAKAPEFTLMDAISGSSFSLSELSSDKGTVVVFMCNHCPFVKHILSTLLEVANQYSEQGIQFIAINSNDIKQYPDDGPEKMRELGLNKKFPFPYLFDDTQVVAKAYHAACTPDFFVFDAALKCVYRGRFDDSTPGNQKPVTGEQLSHSLDCLLQNKPCDPNQKPSMGCNIKWKS